MQCPSCKTDTLTADTLEAGLPCHACTTCSGVLLSLPTYSNWLDRNQNAITNADPATPPFESADSTRALRCPKCQRIMLKFRVAVDCSHTLDFCFTCGEVWLDAGEWGYLKNQGLHAQLRSMTTDTWQRHIREASSARLRREKLIETLGQDAFPVVEEFRQWLEQHPRRDDILRYLNADH